MSLSTSVISSLSTSAIAALNTSDIAALTTAMVNLLTSTQLGALTTANISVLSTTNLSALTTAQFAQGLTTRQIAALTTAQVNQGLTTAQIIGLSTMQILALKTTQTMAMTTTQAAALTTAQLTALAGAGRIPSIATGVWTPITLDLNGDGVHTLGTNAGVQFASQPGQLTHTGWVSPADGLLALDRNHDGLINDGSELFGSSTILPSGQKAADGYVALKAMDSNSDGVIDSQDAGWADLRVWTDKNSDGVSQAGELATLGSLGIVKLDLAATPASVSENGNWVGLVSSFETVDGASHAMADVWFASGQSESAAPLRTLRTQVTGMVQAMSSFDSLQAGGSSDAGSPVTSLHNPDPANSGVTVLANVNGIADVLRQFDANGNPIGNVTGMGVFQSVSSGTSVNVLGEDVSKSGWLTMGKS